jgi:hypothetical protein
MSGQSCPSVGYSLRKVIGRAIIPCQNQMQPSVPSPLDVRYSNDNAFAVHFSTNSRTKLHLRGLCGIVRLLQVSTAADRQNATSWHELSAWPTRRL